MRLGELVKYQSYRWSGKKSKMGIVVEHEVSPRIEHISCFDGPTGGARTRVAWVDGSGLEWVDSFNLTREKFGQTKNKKGS